MGIWVAVDLCRVHAFGVGDSAREHGFADDVVPEYCQLCGVFGGDGGGGE